MSSQLGLHNCRLSYVICVLISKRWLLSLRYPPSEFEPFSSHSSRLFRLCVHVVSRILRVHLVSQESEDAVKALAKEKDLLEREKWDLRRQTKEATEHTGLLRSQLDLKENRIKELEAELAMVRSPGGEGGNDREKSPNSAVMMFNCRYNSRVS